SNLYLPRKKPLCRPSKSRWRCQSVNNPTCVRCEETTWLSLAAEAPASRSKSASVCAKRDLSTNPLRSTNSRKLLTVSCFMPFRSHATGLTGLPRPASSPRFPHARTFALSTQTHQSIVPILTNLKSFFPLFFGDGGIRPRFPLPQLLP